MSDTTERLTHTHTHTHTHSNTHNSDGGSVTTLRLKGAQRKGTIRGKLSRLADTETKQVVTSGERDGGKGKAGVGN